MFLVIKKAKDGALDDSWAHAFRQCKRRYQRPLLSVNNWNIMAKGATAVSYSLPIWWPTRSVIVVVHSSHKTRYVGGIEPTVGSLPF